jgi:anaerobic magnesium-protoporphyrin IX monomethyl ester cyclase
VDKDIITVGGGAHPTVMPELVLSDKNADFAVLGEGEETIIDLVNYLEGKQSIADTDGLAYRDNGNIRIIPRTRFIADLDALPFPARHLLDMEKYFGLKFSHGTRKKKRFSPIVTSRGCPAKCTFCSAYRVWGRRFRYRSPENVIAEMKHIKERYGIEEIMFEDDNVTLNVNRAGRLFDMMIEEKLDFVWDTPNGVAVYALNERLIDKMKASGCYSLNLALESGSQEVLDNIIKKPVRLPRAKELVRYAQGIGIKVKMYLIIGMPGETKEQMWANFQMAKELGIYTPFVSVATPYPGSALYDTCREKGYIPPDFSLDNLFIRSFSISTEDWTGDDVREILRQGYRMLLLANYRHHPLALLRTVIKSFLSHPLGFTKKAIYFLMNKAVK